VLVAFTTVRVALAAQGIETVSGLKFFTLEGGMCPYAARTWICFLELDMDYETVGINGLKKPEWYEEINPKGKVPAIQNLVDGSLVYESAICDEYLCDLAQSTDPDGPPGESKVWKLMPIGPGDRAALRLMNDHVDTEVCPAHFTFLMNKDGSRDEVLKDALEKALVVLEDTLVSHGGPYLMGSEFTIADVHFLPFFLRLVVSLRYFKEYEVPSEKYPRLLQWLEICSRRDSVKAASPSDERIIELYKKFVEAEYGFGGLNKNK